MAQKYQQQRGGNGSVCVRHGIREYTRIRVKTSCRRVYGWYARGACLPTQPLDCRKPGSARQLTLRVARRWVSVAQVGDEESWLRHTIKDAHECGLQRG